MTCADDAVAVRIRMECHSYEAAVGGTVGESCTALAAAEHYYRRILVMPRTIVI